MVFLCKECGRIILSCFNKGPLFKTVISEIICLLGVRHGLSLGIQSFSLQIISLRSFKEGSLLVSLAISLIPIASRIGVTCKV